MLVSKDIESLNIELLIALAQNSQAAEKLCKKIEDSNGQIKRAIHGEKNAKRTKKRSH